MPKFSGNFVTQKIDVSSYRRALEKELIEAISFAAFQWLNAVTNRIPIWSGASQATLLKLASDAGFSLVITPKSNAPDRRSLGRSKSKGGFEFDRQRGRFFFRYSTTLEHLIFNEFKNANLSPAAAGLFSQLKTPGPYRFQALGQAVFRRATQNTSLPDLRRHIKQQTVKVG